MAPKVPKRQANDAAKTRKQPVTNEIVIHRGVGMPKRFRTTLRAVYNGNIAVTGTAQTLGFGCNTPNIPIRGDSEERCGYWDKLYALYDRAYTISSQIHFELVNVTVNDGVRVVLSHDSTSLTSANVNSLAEKEGATEMLLGHYSGGRVVYRASHQWNPAGFIGVAPSSVANTVAGGDPPDPYFWIVSTQTAGGGTGNLVYKVVIEYDVVFAELTFPFE
jgi:hypothetical protein